MQKSSDKNLGDFVYVHVFVCVGESYVYSCQNHTGSAFAGVVLQQGNKKMSLLIFKNQVKLSRRKTLSASPLLSTCFMCCIFVMTVLLLQAAAEVTGLRTRPCAVTH